MNQLKYTKILLSRPPIFHFNFQIKYSNSNKLNNSNSIKLENWNFKKHLIMNQLKFTKILT